MDGNIRDLISLLTLLIAVWALLQRIFSGRDKEIVQMIADAKKEFDDRMKGMNAANTRANDAVRNYANDRCAAINAASETNKSDIRKLEMDTVRQFAQYPTKDDLAETLQIALRPLQEGQERTTKFMEEILRAGVLRARRERGNTD